MRIKLHGLVLLTMLFGILVGCAAPAAPVELATNLSAAEVESLWQDEAITVIDVREDFEFDAGHIPGALWIPLGELPDRLEEVPTDGPVVMVCRSGNRSSQAFQFLQKEGFPNAHNMLGGMNDWSASGYDIEK